MALSTYSEEEPVLSKLDNLSYTQCPADITRLPVTLPNSDNCTRYSLGARVIFGGVVAVLGLGGNVLTVIVMAPDRKKSATIQCLLYLAVVDSLVLLQYGFASVSIPALQLYHQPQLALRVQMYLIAKLIPCAQATNHLSVGITVMVTWQRYICVCLPHQAKQYGSRKVVKILLLILILFVWLFNLPQLFQYRVVYDEPTPGLTVLVPTQFALRKSFSVFYMVGLFYTITYIFPMTGLTIMSFWLVKATVQSRKDLTPTNRTQKAKQDVTVSLLVVVAVFMVCQSVTPVLKLLMFIYPKIYHKHIQCGGKLFYFGPWILNSLLLNSSANFIIYTVCAKGFRSKLIKLLQTR